MDIGNWQATIHSESEVAQSCPTLFDPIDPIEEPYQAPLSIGFSRQEYWSGLPFPPAENLPNPGIEPSSLTSPALAGRLFTTSTTWEAAMEYYSAAKRNKARSFVEM